MKIDLEAHDIQAIAERVLDTLKPYLPRNTREDRDDTIFDVPGLCEYLKVSRKWVYQQTYLKAIPQANLGGKQLRFRKRDIDKWVDAHSVPALTKATTQLRVFK